MASIVGWGPGIKRTLNATETELNFTAMKWHKIKWQFHGSGEPWGALEQGNVP